MEEKSGKSSPSVSITPATTTTTSGGIPARHPETSLWANRKCILICVVVAVANAQYGLDSLVLASLQAMPGFLIVFGHPDPNVSGGYGIGVSPGLFSSSLAHHLLQPPHKKRLTSPPRGRSASSNN